MLDIDRADDLIERPVRQVRRLVDGRAVHLRPQGAEALALRDPPAGKARALRVRAADVDVDPADLERPRAVERQDSAVGGLELCGDHRRQPESGEQEQEWGRQNGDAAFAPPFGDNGVEIQAACLYLPLAMSQKPLTYADAGVSIDAGNALVKAIGPLARSTARPGADAELGGFGGLFDLEAAGYSDPLLVAANDGVGTKLKLAIETGRHDGVGIDLVAMCANDLVVQGAEPLFFLDYYATGKLDQAVASAVVASIAEGCRRAGCALIGGETAEMPGMYAPGDYDLAGFCVGAVERDKVLTGADIAPGDLILGLASSGVHSNGFSLVRRIIEQEHWNLDERLPGEGGRTFAEVLLEPTRIYVRALLPLVQECRIKGLAHITGGGILENIPRVLPEGCHAIVRSRPLGLAADLRASAARRPNRSGGNGADLQLRDRHGGDRRARTGRSGNVRPERRWRDNHRHWPDRRGTAWLHGQRPSRLVGLVRGLVRDSQCVTRNASQS